jgi:hypothetical protein
MIDLRPGLGAWYGQGSDWLRVLRVICRPGSAGGARTDRSGGRDLIGALASTVSVLSAVPAVGASPTGQAGRRFQDARWAG